MPAPTVDPTAPLVLWVAICDERRGYKVTFPVGTDELAARFMNDRMQDGIYATGEYGNHAFTYMDGEDGEPSACLSAWPKVEEILYPTCEHGLSEWLCMGPDHYMDRAQEMAMGWG